MRQQKQLAGGDRQTIPHRNWHSGSGEHLAIIERYDFHSTGFVNDKGAPVTTHRVTKILVVHLRADSLPCLFGFLFFGQKWIRAPFKMFGEPTRAVGLTYLADIASQLPAGDQPGCSAMSTTFDG